MAYIQLTDDLRAEMYEYLFALRDSGATNMWSGATYLQHAFNVERLTATRVMLDWMELCKAAHTALEDA